ncbi:hypothetical protein EDC04DRAFT_2606622 [Pisolithus marmoratus]|nr:hypothetical protein EDC04DRAFT_2606622 [Pisolithus marmoratus]
MSHGGSVAPMSHQGSVVPTTQRGFVPASGGGSIVLVSHGSSVVPMSHGDSAAPSSHGGSSPPSSHTIDLRRRTASYQITTTPFFTHWSVMMVFIFKVPSIHRLVAVFEDDRAAESLIQNYWQQECRSQKPQTSYKGGAPSPQIAKQLAQCGATSDPFPSRAWFINEKSAMYITEAMAECEQVGVLIPPGYWPDYHKDLGILHYLLGGNRPAEENLANAQELIWGAKFGTTRNMASPALAGLVIDFFYATPSALGHLFPEVFAWEVPKSVVCLAATVLMAMQAKIDCNHKHAAMTQALRMSWATTGSAVQPPQSATV